MCAIFGAISYSFSAPSAVMRANATLSHIYNASSARGRDGVGFTWKGDLWEGTPSTGDKRELDGAYRTNNLEQYRTQFVPARIRPQVLLVLKRRVQVLRLRLRGRRQHG